jgi:hypothetical protein
MFDCKPAIRPNMPRIQRRALRETHQISFQFVFPGRFLATHSGPNVIHSIMVGNTNASNIPAVAPTNGMISSSFGTKIAINTKK